MPNQPRNTATMPTSTTLARVLHRTVLRPAGGIRAAAATTVIPIQHMRCSPQFIQQRFAATSGDTSKRGSGSSGRGSRSSGSGSGTEKTEAEILAADIDADLDYPIAAMDEQYSTTSWSDTPAGKSAAAKMASTAAGAGASEQQQSTAASGKTTASGTKHETLVGKADNTLFYLAMGFLGLTGAYLVLKPNPHPSASSSVVEPRVDAKSSSSQPPSTQMQQGGSPPSARRT